MKKPVQKPQYSSDGSFVVSVPVFCEIDQLMMRGFGPAGREKRFAGIIDIQVALELYLYLSFHIRFEEL